MKLLRLAVLSSLVLASGCIYTNVNTPLSYRSATPADIHGPLGVEVEGRACSSVILFLFAFGDGGYAAAVTDAKIKAGASLLADVKADRNLVNVLGVYQRACTVVTGRAVVGL